MKDKKIFVDTNIFVYAYDINAGPKHVIAKENIYKIWDALDLFYISIQVLQEFFVTLIRKNISHKTARETIEDYLCLNIVNNDASLLLKGIRLKEQWKISFWDALILAAAKQAKADILWSEDFNHKQNYGNITSINPLLK